MNGSASDRNDHPPTKLRVAVRGDAPPDRHYQMYKRRGYTVPESGKTPRFDSGKLQQDTGACSRYLDGRSIRELAQPCRGSVRFPTIGLLGCYFSELYNTVVHRLLSAGASKEDQKILPQALPILEPWRTLSDECIRQMKVEAKKKLHVDGGPCNCAEMGSRAVDNKCCT